MTPVEKLFDDQEIAVSEPSAPHLSRPQCWDCRPMRRLQPARLYTNFRQENQTAECVWYCDHCGMMYDRADGERLGQVQHDDGEVIRHIGLSWDVAIPQSQLRGTRPARFAAAYDGYDTPVQAVPLVDWVPDDDILSWEEPEQPTVTQLRGSFDAVTATTAELQRAQEELRRVTERTNEELRQVRAEHPRYGNRRERGVSFTIPASDYVMMSAREISQLNDGLWREFHHEFPGEEGYFDRDLDHRTDSYTVRIRPGDGSDAYEGGVSEREVEHTNLSW